MEPITTANVTICQFWIQGIKNGKRWTETREFLQPFVCASNVPFEVKWDTEARTATIVPRDGSPTQTTTYTVLEDEQ